MEKHPKKLEINYKFVNELFNLAKVSHSSPPTEEECQQLVLSIQEKISTLEKMEQNKVESLQTLFSLGPDIDKTATEGKILVVDDLVMVTYQLSILLSKIGYNVSLARSAPEAVSTFKSSNYDYVLMDLHMPEKEDGFYLLNALKNKIEMENLRTKVVVMSGIADAASVEYCLNNGACSFIEKNDDWKKEIVNCLSKLK